MQYHYGKIYSSPFFLAFLHCFIWFFIILADITICILQCLIVMGPSPGPSGGVPDLLLGVTPVLPHLVVDEHLVRK